MVKRAIVAAAASAAMGTWIIGMVAAPASVAGGNVAITNLRGPLINAGFSDTDPSGCISTDVFVSANSGTEQDVPNTVVVGVASVSIYRYDSCTGTTLLDAAGLKDTLGAGEFEVSNQLDWATLHTAISVNDLVSGNTFEVSVDVALTGTSDIVRNHENTNDIYPGCHILNRWKGSGRDADASGVVSDGVTNFTPVGSENDEIGLVISGSEIVGCP